MNEVKLHLYHVDHEEYVIAESPEEANQLMDDECGVNYVEEGCKWEQYPDDKEIKLFDVDNWNKETKQYEILGNKTAAEWCESEGRGYFSSTNC